MATDHAQCHRDIDQLLAEIELLRNMLRLCEQHCSDGWVAEQTRTLLAHSVARIDGFVSHSEGGTDEQNDEQEGVT